MKTLHKAIALRELADEDYERMEPDDPRYVFDVAAMRADIIGRIVIKADDNLSSL